MSVKVLRRWFKLKELCAMKNDKFISKPMSKKLIELRKRNRLSMREAAKRIGVPETTYRDWEYGRAIRGEPYVQIARAFGISLLDLLEESTSSKELSESDFDRIISDLIKIKNIFFKKNGH